MTIPLPPRIYLASHSPRRRELLTQIGVLFDSLISRGSPRQDPEVDETPFPGEDPVTYVQRVTLAKAEHGVQLMTMRHLIAQPVLAADTTVAVEGRFGLGLGLHPIDRASGPGRGVCSSRRRGLRRCRRWRGTRASEWVW